MKIKGGKHRYVPPVAPPPNKGTPPGVYMCLLAHILPWTGALIALILTIPPAKAQVPRGPAARTADGKPDLNGVWQALNTADWDLEGHAAAMGPVALLGAVFAVPPGMGVVEGDTIPYLPEAAAKKKENQANWLKLDPEVKCYLPGVPRATYLPYPFQIIQGQDNILFAYEYANTERVINMGTPTKPYADTRMGWSNGHWEGQTLVIDVTGFIDSNWFDHAGNFHSDALHVVERYTPRSPETLNYDATIEDPKVFSRPWKISMPLYRRVEKNFRLLEFRCAEFAEELLYGDLVKKSGK
jgi:hypothetical protein